MIEFKKMLETFSSKGILASHKDDRSPFYMGPNELKYLQFLENLDYCQHFVFTPKNESPLDATTLESPEKIDLPFKAISIEVLDAPITVSRPDDVLDVSTTCLYVIERAPRDYLVFALLDSSRGREVMLVTGASDDGGMRAMIQNYMDRLSLEREGVALVREKLKVGSGQSKRFHTIRRIIYVTPKKDVENLNSKVSKPIDWSQRWLVRGHWRKNMGLGKDREGVYCVEGFTWVTEHAKGPEHLPLIQKTRFVK